MGECQVGPRNDLAGRMTRYLSLARIGAHLHALNFAGAAFCGLPGTILSCAASAQASNLLNLPFGQQSIRRILSNKRFQVSLPFCTDVYVRLRVLIEPYYQIVAMPEA